MDLNLGKWYRILVPRPVVLVSTIDTEGVSNAAPFSFVMPVSFNPPLIAFASSPAHDTAKNIIKSGDFVVNIPSKGILKAVWACAGSAPAGVSKIKKAGLTEEKSEHVKSPGIKECLARFECKLLNKYDAGDHILFVGEVLRTYVSDDYVENGKYLISKSNALMHIEGAEFGLLGKIVKV